MRRGCRKFVVGVEVVVAVIIDTAFALPRQIREEAIFSRNPKEEETGS